jgi:hypothetical protein
MTWLIVVLVVAAVLAIGAVLIEQRRTGALRSRFGPEYDRLVEASGDRREAEAALRERIKRRKALDLADLSPAARERYVVQWRAVQAGFVDDPRQALVAAVQLVEQAAAERGYRADAPDGDGDGETGSADPLELMAVDHPHEAGGLREARRVLGEADAPVEDLRTTFVGCRGLFDALVTNGNPADAVRVR